MFGRPAKSTAAAAEAPAGTRTILPSTSTAMVGGVPSGRARNTEASGQNRRNNWIERAGRDHWREGVGVRRRQRDATMAVRCECAGKLLGFIVDRQAVGRDDPQCRPGAHDLQFGDPRERYHRPPRDISHDLGLLAGVEADILLAAA